MSDQSERLQRGKPYPLGDPLSVDECNQFGVDWKKQWRSSIMAVGTGEKRPPKKGEWYLSGAIITAYRAPNDFTSEYHIARLVKVRTTTVTEVIG